MEVWKEFLMEFFSLHKFVTEHKLELSQTRNHLREFLVVCHRKKSSGMEVSVEIDFLTVKLAKEGDDQAFSKLYEIIYKDMYRYAYYMLGNEEEAKDIVSDTVFVMYQNIKKLRHEELFRSWAFKILSNKCKKRRKQYINQTISIEESINEDLIKDKIDGVTDCEQRHDIQNAFKVLTYEEKNVVSLAVFGGYKSNEIGDLLKIKPTTVRSKLSRALKKMQDKLEVQL